MKKNSKLFVIAAILLIAIGNYSRLHGAEHIRGVEFLSIFAIGALTAILIRETAAAFKSNTNEK